MSGTDGANRPFFSPDGQWIGIFADSKLKKVAVQGGFLVTLCYAALSGGGGWGDDDNIIAAPNVGSGLSRIPSGGGAPAPVTEVKKEKGEVMQGSPQVLPGSHAVLLTSPTCGRLREYRCLVVEDRRADNLQRGGFAFGWYLPSGHLVYMQQNTLFAAPFDLSRLAVTGAPQPVLQDVNLAVESPHWNFDFSRAKLFAAPENNEASATELHRTRRVNACLLVIEVASAPVYADATDQTR